MGSERYASDANTVTNRNANKSSKKSYFANLLSFGQTILPYSCVMSNLNKGD
jgi:hypothetical protein